MRASVSSEELIDRPLGTLITATIVLVTSCLVSFRMPAAIRTFQQMFVEFGADISGLTRWVLVAPDFWLIFGVLAVPLFIWVVARPRMARAEYVRMKLALGALIALMVLAYGVAAWAIYTPIFKLGQSI